MDENALICDFAETYHIYDYRSLPARQAAIFAAGLRDTSRTMIRRNNERVPRELFIQAIIADRLGMIYYSMSDGTAKKPASLVNLLLGIDSQEGGHDDIISFDTPEDFDKAWKGGCE